MASSESVTDTKSRLSATLPSEIVTEEILPKLPGKSLVRFKCVSKSFKTWISSPEFIDIHLGSNRHIVFVGHDDSELYSFDIDSPDPSPAVKIPLPCTPSSYEVNSIIGSFNGLLCVELKSKDRMGKYKPVLINPHTGWFREIPNVYIIKHHPTSDMFRVSFGFGYDDTKHDYKIVTIVEIADNYCPYAGDIILSRDVKVYSLKENEWKLVENRRNPTDSLEFGQNGVFMKNHLIHWLFCGPSHGRYRICCFDVRSENWAKEVPLMDLYTCPDADFHEELKDERIYVHELGIVDGCLCLSTSTHSAEIVWIMKEYGVKESWVKLFEIPRLCLSRPLSDHCSFGGPFGFRHGSKDRKAVLVQHFGKDNSAVFWCDCEIESPTYCSTEIIKGVPGFRRLACFLNRSFVYIPGGQQIKAASSTLDEQIC